MSIKKEVRKIEERDLVVFQAENGAIELKEDVKNETVWATQKQLAEIFSVDRTVISKHIKNIINDKEVDEKVVCAKFAHTTRHGAIEGKTQTKEVIYYNLDIILAIGYRTNSARAIEFRKWATKTLKEHITKGYTLNEKILKRNQQRANEILEQIQYFSKNIEAKNSDILELVKAFTNTWFTLESYDEDNFPAKGFTKKDLNITAENLYLDVEKFKKELIEKNEATELFAQEKNPESLKGIFGNVMQSVFGKEVYPTVEEKAVNLLYFIIKNHPFNDGNKRTGAFAFIWFLEKSEMSFKGKITPEALAVITLFVAESKAEDKEKIIGLLLLLLK